MIFQAKSACELWQVCSYATEYAAHLGRRETSFKKIKKRTSRYIPIAHWSYKAYSLFHTKTETTTTVFDLSDNLHR